MGADGLLIRVVHTQVAHAIVNTVYTNDLISFDNIQYAHKLGVCKGFNRIMNLNEIMDFKCGS